MRSSGSPLSLRGLAWILCSVLLLAKASPLHSAGLIRTLDGDSFSGRLVSISPTWQIRFATESGERQLSLANLVLFGEYQDDDDGPQLLLADGGLLRADVLAISTDTISVESRLWREASIPLDLVRAIVFIPPADARQRDALYERISSSTGGEDQLFLANGDTIQGQLLPANQGRLLSPDESRLVNLRAAGRELSVSIESVSAIVFNPSLVQRPRPKIPHAAAGFTDGSLLHVESWRMAEDDSITMSLAGGIALTLEPPPFTATGETAWSHITMLQSVGTSVVYLSDLEAASYKHIPLLDREWPFRQDHCVSGGRLRVRELLYRRGIGMHANSRLAYALGDQYQRFDAELAIDQSADEHGSVIFRVFVNDASGQWQRAYESPVSRAGEAPIAMSVDVTGARAMALIVDGADRATVGDQADWLNARLIPR
ncbi:MAG: NPCBM/NEW2 domain-containing protein [Planctomycetales bacterium]|nr:NPCBM/NEW2 domain-containing protein [Planctomycetales bacterium]